MTGSVLTLSVHTVKKDNFAGIVVIEGEEIPRLPGGSSSNDPNAPQRKPYELPLVPDTLTPELNLLMQRSSKYKNELLKRKNNSISKTL